MSKTYEDKNRYLKALEKIRDLKTQNLKIEIANFKVVFEKYPSDLFYCDPPYFLERGSKMFRGIYPIRSFPIHHNNFNHELLAICLKNHRGKFILSYNGCEFVREAYKDFKILRPK